MTEHSASLIFWEFITNFTEDEFSHVNLEDLSEDWVIELQNYRDILGCQIFLSPDPEAFCRYDGSKTSRHYAVGRLSNAGDVFPNCHIAEAFLSALRTRFGGIGVYLDTHFKGQKMPMLHLDMRLVDNQAVWIRETINDKQVYTTFYPHKDPAVLCEILKKISEA